MDLASIIERVTEVSLTSGEPAAAGRKPAMARISVVLPEPDSPTTARVSPSPTVRDTPATAAMLPLDYTSDEEMFAAALPTIGLAEPPEAKILWIRNTLDLAEFECSEAYLPLAEGLDDAEILVPPRHVPFDENGDLPWITGLSVD